MRFSYRLRRLANHVATFVAIVAFFGSALGQTSRPAAKPIKPSETSGSDHSDPGAISNGVYRNTGFGFTCKVPFGWVDRTREMSENSNEASNSDPNAPKKSILLLATFERPPEASGDSVNTAIVVAAEATSSYPGLQNAEQYFGPLSALTTSKGFTVADEPYDFRVGTTQLVRADFNKPIGHLTMWQSTLVRVENGYVVSFTFIAGSEEEIDDLIHNLSFGGKESTASHK